MNDDLMPCICAYIGIYVDEDCSMDMSQMLTYTSLFAF